MVLAVSASLDLEDSVFFPFPVVWSVVTGSGLLMVKRGDKSLISPKINVAWKQTHLMTS